MIRCGGQHYKFYLFPYVWELLVDCHRQLEGKLQEACSELYDPSTSWLDLSNVQRWRLLEKVLIKTYHLKTETQKAQNAWDVLKQKEDEWIDTYVLRVDDTANEVEAETGEVVGSVRRLSKVRNTITAKYREHGLQLEQHRSVGSVRGSSGDHREEPAAHGGRRQE